MPTRNVVLTERHEEMIAELVARAISEREQFLREGLRLIEGPRHPREKQAQALRKAARTGLLILT